MKSDKIDTPTLILIIVLLLGLINGLTSCSTRQIAHTPSNKEIKRAMRYSTSDYYLPQMPDNAVSNKSHFTFTYNK